MWSLVTYDGPPVQPSARNYVVETGAAIGKGDSTRRLSPIHPVLPLRVIWPQFLMNWAIYFLVWSAILLIVLLLLLHARRWLRLRRGECPKCGYPAGVSQVCTECGHALPAQLVQPRDAQSTGASSSDQNV